MKLTIYDVSHGFCARLVTPLGQNYFFDCGFAADSTPHPIEELQAENVTTVEQLVFTNYDEDHVRGLPELRKAVKIRSIKCNRALSATDLQTLKQEGGGVTDAMTETIKMLKIYSSPYTAPETGGVKFTYFQNNYADFQDTNNLSVVTLVEYKTLVVLFTGDMEKAGWDKMLQNAAFREALAKVHVFVASHHGRENGYCQDVFIYCKPQIVVISDKEYMYDTQETDYAKHATGIAMADGTTRRLYTTRNDGTLFIAENPAGTFMITTEH
jgi:beta-lactamase superfamily II metal-dependent hydrolase